VSGRRRDRLRPVLLSGLVFPGLGQLASGRPLRALAFAAPSAGLLVLLVRRVASETVARMPESPEALLDPALPFRLAVEIQRANASFFLWVTAGLVVLWILSMVDAWLAAGRQAGPRPHSS
jgi:hypothetical protein